MLPEWPECRVCGDEFSPARYALGYRTCLEHGEERKKFLIIPLPKSNYVVGTREELKTSYQNKGPRI